MSQVCEKVVSPKRMVFYESITQVGDTSVIARASSCTKSFMHEENYIIR